MPYTPRSLTDISQAVRGTIRQYLPGTDATLVFNVLTVIAKTKTLFMHEYELRLEHLARQIFLRSSDGAYVEAHAGEYGITRTPASRATGTVTIAGQNGEVVPSGLRLLFGDAVVETTATATVASGVASGVPVRAVQPGVAGNIASGTQLAVIDPSATPGLAQTATVDNPSMGGGADQESISALRARTLQRKRKPPQGGNLDDYERFVLAMPDVAQAWAVRFANGPGTIGVYARAGSGLNGIPTPAAVAAWDAALLALRLVRTDTQVIGVTGHGISVTIADLSNDTPDIRAAIEEGLRSMFIERSNPGTATEPYVLSRSWVSEAISQAAGEDRHTLSSPAADITLPAGSVPVLGALTFV